MAAAAIRTSGLTKDYGGGRGIFDLDMQVSVGQTFGLLGPDGAGKTTFLRLLMGLIHPSRGSAYVFGVDCFRDAAEVKRRVGYAPDKSPDFGSMQGGDVVAYLAGLRGGVHGDRIRELAQRVDVDLGRRHQDYGPSERRKLSLLLAFMHEPDLLILDEPYRDLGERAASELKRLISEARDEGATILLASPSVAEVESHCDAVALLRRGKLARAMRIEDLPAQLDEPGRKALPP